MKKITLLLLALGMLACAPKDDKIVITINGTTLSPELEGESVHLVSYNGDVLRDSTFVKNGKFTLNDTLDSPEILRIHASTAFANILAQHSSEIEVKLQINGEGMVTDGGGLNDKSREVNEGVRQKVMELRAKIEVVAKEKDISFDEAAEEFGGKNIPLEICKEYIEANRDNLIGVMLLGDITSEINSLRVMDSLIALVPLSKNSQMVMNGRKAIETLEATKVGKPFVNFTGKNLEGEGSSLSDYVGRGKYVLVDFWASWCAPCKEEIPTLLAAQKKYGTDKLSILGVNVWDVWDNFTKDVNRGEMPWNHLFMEGSTATKLYGIQSIPEIILFAPDGTIVERSLRGGNIDKALAKALGQEE